MKTKPIPISNELKRRWRKLTPIQGAVVHALFLSIVTDAEQDQEIPVAQLELLAFLVLEMLDL